MKLHKVLAAGLIATLFATTLSIPSSAQSSQQSSPSSSQLVDGLAHAATPAGNPLYSYDPFYDDLVTELGTPGTLLRTQAAPHLLNLLGPDFPGYAEKILYTSTTVHGDPVATSGFVIEPANQWAGIGPTPTVIFAPGTRGAGDVCAPSRGPWLTGQLRTDPVALGANYELPAYYAASVLGMRVVVVDYIGLGTPGPHTYVLHDEEAHAVLDAARAVVPAGDPIAFHGYSQGGGAVAAAAEQQPTYAPELNLKGTFAGAPPADLLATLDGVDGSSIMSVIGYAANGWAARYPTVEAALENNLNDRGRAFLTDTADGCTIDGVAKWALQKTSDLSSTGESLTEIMRKEGDLAKLFDDQKLGRRAPTTPILVSTGGNDDAVPTGQVIELARDYCAAGVTTTLLNENIAPLTPGIKLGLNHALGIFTQAGPAFNWITDRFNDVPATTNCGTF